MATKRNLLMGIAGKNSTFFQCFKCSYNTYRRSLMIHHIRIHHNMKDNNQVVTLTTLAQAQQAAQSHQITVHKGQQELTQQMMIQSKQGGGKRSLIVRLHRLSDSMIESITRGIQTGKTGELKEGPEDVDMIAAEIENRQEFGENTEKGHMLSVVKEENVTSLNQVEGEDGNNTLCMVHENRIYMTNAQQSEDGTLDVKVPDETGASSQVLSIRDGTKQLLTGEEDDSMMDETFWENTQVPASTSQALAQQVAQPHQIIDLTNDETENIIGDIVSVEAGKTGRGIEGTEGLLDVESQEMKWIKLDCRIVTFGSYKVIPIDKIVLSEHGVKIEVPCLSKNNTFVINILTRDIVKVRIHFSSAEVSQSIPAVFYDITQEGSKRISDALHMNGISPEVHFDSTSKGELINRITLLPETISQLDTLFIKLIYESRNLMEELSWDEANNILVGATQKEVQNTLKKAPRRGKNLRSTSKTKNIKIIFVYPPAPLKGGLPINSEDYACLRKGRFLNDVIIDFYIQYIWSNDLSEDVRKRTHIFSTFFYSRLSTHSNKDLENHSPAERRHSRVKKWTKSINIFDKDFIVIPVNQSAHWFLVIICFPGLTGPVRISDGTPMPSNGKKKDTTSVLVGGQAPRAAVDIKSKIFQATNKDVSQYDEAEANDDDMEPNTSVEEMINEKNLIDEVTPGASKAKPSFEPIKQPCILVFDSLAHTSRARVCATLREYLQVEWNVRNKGISRDFSKDVFKGAAPKVPQQENGVDCGVYLLQFCEAFFKRPITDFRMPIRSIVNWFTIEEVNQKRYDLMQLLLSLMREQNIDITKLNLPDLHLHPPL